MDTNHGHESYTARGFFVKWLEVVRSKRKPKTYQSYSDTLRLYVPDTFKDRLLARVTPLDIEGVLLALQNKSARIRQLTHAVLRAAFAQAVAWQLIERNPVDGVEAPKVPLRKMNVWTAEELRRFLNHARGDRYELLYRLAAETGWREGELLGLWWSDFMSPAGTLTCNRTLTEIDGRFSYGSPKSEAGKRAVSLSPELTLVLGHRRGLAVNPNGLIFCTREGTPISKSNFYKSFQALVKAAGVPRIRFHDIRHTNATLLLQQKVNPKDVSNRLGHSRVDTTLTIYAKATKEGDLMATQTMRGILNGDV